MKAQDIALAGACALQVAASAAFAAYILRPHWLARFVSDAFLIRHSLWDECEGAPMNVWAEEFLRRDDPEGIYWPGAATAVQAANTQEGGE
jgi:hypothetical protein